jgi:putative restriction endonuclease
MAVRLIVAVTDKDWFDHLSKQPDIPEVNFWAPSAREFRALQPGELFLFKLHAPFNAIAGAGVFAHASNMPCSLAWASFGNANGANSLTEMRNRIAKYRRADPSHRQDFEIGCRIVTQPFFWPEATWLPVPDSWSHNIVTFKTYTTLEADGLRLWDAVHERFTLAPRIGLSEMPQARYGEPTLIHPRLGQGAFRVLVTDLYGRRCAVTRERTLPALDAAHIRPYGSGGEHEPQNGLLLRRDVHSLFDAGYVTVTPDYRFAVSRKIREDYENGRDYYALHGRPIELPSRNEAKPAPDVLRWHNEQVFRG